MASSVNLAYGLGLVINEVRMVLSGHFEVSGLDVVDGGISGDAQDSVVVQRHAVASGQDWAAHTSPEKGQHINYSIGRQFNNKSDEVRAGLGRTD